MTVTFPTFKEYLRNHFTEGPFLATDIIIEYKNGIVLIERKNPPHGLALPGGIAEYMALPDNARKEAAEETGLEVKLREPLEIPFCVESDPSQDPRAFIVSVTYIGKGYGTLRAGDDAKKARVYTLEDTARLVKKQEDWAFPHHRRIIERYLTHKEKYVL